MDRFLTLSFGLAIAACISSGAAAADAAHGKELFMTKCTLCHNADNGGPNKIGPNLWGVVGRPSATAPGFPYSTAMQHASLNWSKDTLMKYLQGPQAMVPGIRMTFPGFSKPEDAADVVAYLETRK